MLPKPKIYKDQSNYKRYAMSHDTCEVCGSLAQDVHHIVGKGMGGRSRDDRDNNLIALCRPCHESAHGIDSKKIREKLLAIKNK